jgi:hypothetical protein
MAQIGRGHINYLLSNRQRRTAVVGDSQLELPVRGSYTFRNNQVQTESLQFPGLN